MVWQLLMLTCLSSCSEHSHPEWPALLDVPGAGHFKHSHEKIGKIETCRMLIVSGGNSQDGGQTFTIDDKNNIEIYRSVPRDLKLPSYEHPIRKHTTHLESRKPLIRSLLASLDLSDLWRHYETDFAEGTGGDLVLTGNSGDLHRCSMRNYFPPEFHELWLRIQRLLAQIPGDQWQYSESTLR